MLIDQDREDLKRQVLETDFTAATMQFPRFKVDSERSKPYLPGLYSGFWHETLSHPSLLLEKA
jgi:hypothetical protein